MFIRIRLVPHYDVEITESCHRYKKDSPSGTALKLPEEINSVKGRIKDQKLSCGFYQMEDVLLAKDKLTQIPRVMPASLKLNFHI